MFAPVMLGHNTESAYAEHADEQLMVIVQMESKGGVAECEKIAAVEGVDCLFIGTPARKDVLLSALIIGRSLRPCQAIGSGEEGTRA